MTTKTAAKPEEEMGTDLIAAVMENPVALFTDTEKFSEFYERVKQETEKLVPDITTVKGRDAIRKMAADVTKTKTAIEKAGKSLVEQWRKQTADVTSARIKMVTELGDLAKSVREPLTEWEDAEDKRVEDAKKRIEWFKLSSVVTIADTSATVSARGNEVYQFEIDPDAFAGFVEQAQDAKQLAITLLFEAKQRLEKDEADRAELARLKQLEEERASREAAEKEQREAEERRKADEEAAQARLEAAEREKEQEAARIAQEREEASQRAAEAAKRDAEIKANLERTKELLERDAEIAAANERAAAVQAELDEKRRIEAEEAADLARREADKAHRTKIMTETKKALMTFNISEEIARAIVLAMKAGELPNCRLVF